MKRNIILATLCFWIIPIHAQFTLHKERKNTISCASNERPVVHTALQLLQRDCEAVFSKPLTETKKDADIIVGTVGVSPFIKDFRTETAALNGLKQAFLLQVLPDHRLLIAGSDAYGTAYGLMELSRLMEVSPWEWWADVTPIPKKKLELPKGYHTLQYPSVEYRGIFINDEDWGLMPWSYQTYEPNPEKGHIGPKTNSRIFELLLRLRANTFWPAMHECTHPFFLTQGNREAARKYGIYIGGSHCEPMACSTAGEWHRRGTGDYDFVNNEAGVKTFWEERVKEVADQEILYTIGMRGVHDGKMQDASTIKEQKEVLEKVFKEQRNLLREHVNADIKQIPQVFIPYKEVLDIYNTGLHVPEDVTLMWCDDNYGYIRHFPTPQEQARSGGNGIYYHISYWGRPHDYLWLGTFNPALLYQQMQLAYDKGIRKMWILNVGDIKPAEYQIELFMDMAWNIKTVKAMGTEKHLGNFLHREFGKRNGGKLLPIMMEHYRLAHICKPEFMGNTRVEEYHTKAYHEVNDMPWSKSFIAQRLADYKDIADRTEAIGHDIVSQRQDAYFQLVKYPVLATYEMNKKLLYAQSARHGEMDWEASDEAFDSIVSLTNQYNEKVSHGKWKHIMSYRPRNLNVFKRIPRKKAETSMTDERRPIKSWNAIACNQGSPIPHPGLGYEDGAATILKDEFLAFSFKNQTDSVEVELRMLPTHPVEGSRQRISVSLNGKDETSLSYSTQGRSEAWKRNVLRNQAILRIKLPCREKGKQHLQIKALDEGVVLDQVLVYPL